MDYSSGDRASVRRTVDAIGSNNESLGGRAHEIEWITCHESQGLVASGIQHLNVVRFDDLRRDDFIQVLSLAGGHLDRVIVASKP
jgi:hypothetical protein